MMEKDLIQSRGFQNVSRDGKIIGFQIQYRTPYYRGVWLTLITGAEITVDGEKFGMDKITWTISGRTFTHEQLGKEPNVHWPYLEPAILTASKPGGLSIGVHEVEVAYSYRASYMGSGPDGDIGPRVFKKKMVLMG
jgi:hypothetical protein